MSSDVAIRVLGLSKSYAIYQAPRDRLKQFVMPRLQRLAGRPPRHYFREFWALRDVSFEVRRGETFGIIGRNGSGKSTLLQLICGTLTPTAGQVETFGRIAALLELGAGFNPEFSGRENIFMNAKVLGLTNEQINQRFDDICAFADIGDFIDQPVKTYSSGMYVRLAFAVIAHVDADILIIDEALAVGDAYFVQKCMRYLRRFLEHGTLLFVSHDTGAVLNLCKRALLLGGGKVVMDADPKAVTQRYLADLYKETQEVTVAGIAITSAAAGVSDEVPRDMRADLINGSRLRNDIEVFRFDPGAESFGARAATVESVRLLDEAGRHLSWTVGGEAVQLEVVVAVSGALVNPIVGFMLKDRLGQVIFGDNTFLANLDRPAAAERGDLLTASFEFRMPVLPTGDYSIGVAVADGTQVQHVQHHWVHDAVLLRAHASSVCFGLIGVPMKRVTLQVSQTTGVRVDG